LSEALLQQCKLCSASSTWQRRHRISSFWRLLMMFAE
jgi:hypothetical protein